MWVCGTHGSVPAAKGPLANGRGCRQKRSLSPSRADTRGRGCLCSRPGTKLSPRPLADLPPHTLPATCSDVSFHCLYSNVIDGLESLSPVDGKLLPDRPDLTLSLPSQSPLRCHRVPSHMATHGAVSSEGQCSPLPGRAGPLSQARPAASHPAPRPVSESPKRAPHDPLRARWVLPTTAPRPGTSVHRGTTSMLPAARPSARDTGSWAAGVQARPESPPQPHLFTCRTRAQECGCRWARLYPARDGGSYRGSVPELGSGLKMTTLGPSLLSPAGQAISQVGGHPKPASLSLAQHPKPHQRSDRLWPVTVTAPHQGK